MQNGENKMIFSKKNKKDMGTLLVAGPMLGAVAGISGAGPVTSKLSAGLPVMGSLIGSGMVLNQLNKFQKKFKKY